MEEPMPYDIESTYRRSLPDFIRVAPEGFAIGGRVEPTLEVSIQDEQVVKKLWNQGRLLCQSPDGLASTTTRKPCRLCRDQRRCTSQIILYVLAADSPYRIALNYTSAQNYLAYRRTVIGKGLELREGITVLSVASHATWVVYHPFCNFLLGGALP
jgi:hypothetical protein